MKYNIIYADPPWKYSGKGTWGAGFRPPEDYYQTMALEDIIGLNVKEQAAKDAALFLWTTDSVLPVALKAMKAWGFRYCTIAFVWVKREKSGKARALIAPWTMKSCEICLLGTKGAMKKYKKVNNVRQLIEATVTRHSSKPYETRARIERLFGDIPKVELFARYKAPGWDAWGNEVESDIELEVP